MSYNNVMKSKILHFGGNGHSQVRLERVRRALQEIAPEIELNDVPYPGFEGREQAKSLSDFLENLSGFVRANPPHALVASGIGALIALSLRAEGELAGTPLIFQGPVLWGLEHRLMPRVMKWSLPRAMLAKAFKIRFFQDRFCRKQFRKPLDDRMRKAFFDGYADCTSFTDLFDWFGPEWLRKLEADFQAHPDRLANITIWLSGRDKVVGRLEIDATAAKLPIDWRVLEFPNWGHYPAIDEPLEWAQALVDGLAHAQRP